MKSISSWQKVKPFTLSIFFMLFINNYIKKEVKEIGNTKIEKVKNANQLRFLNYILILIDILN